MLPVGSVRLYVGTYNILTDTGFDLLPPPISIFHEINTPEELLTHAEHFGATVTLYNPGVKQYYQWNTIK